MKRIRREFYGLVARIPPHVPGALATCAFCEWGRFYRDNKRKHWNAVDRAGAALRGHARKCHADKFPKFSTAEDIFGRGAKNIAGCVDARV
jgi:hypothetical protein